MVSAHWLPTDRDDTSGFPFTTMTSASRPGCAPPHLGPALAFLAVRIGPSRGGREIPVAGNRRPIRRTIIPWTETPFLLWMHIGLEDTDYLIADHEAGFARLNLVFDSISRSAAARIQQNHDLRRRA